MTPYDLAMAGVVIAGMIWGALRGITWQVASIASLVLGYAVSFPMSSQLAPHFPGEPVVARALAMLTLYVAVSGGIYLAAWSIRTILKQWQFEAYDRHLGMMLGGLEGAILGIVLTLFVVSFSPSLRPKILTSPTGRVVTAVLNAAQPALPGEIRTVLAPFWTDARPAQIASRPGGEERTSDRVLEEAEPRTRGDRRPRSGDDDAPAPAASAKELLKEGADRLQAELSRDDDSGAAPKDDPSVVKSLLKEGADRLDETLKKKLKVDPEQKARLRQLLKKGSERVGQAVSETLQEGIDKIDVQPSGGDAPHR